MNSDLQQKLQRFSATPPDGVWNKIADALDEDGGFAQRLYDYEEQPPTVTWNQLEKQLAETPAEAPVVPITKRFRMPMRYIAVACFFAVLLVAITLTMERTEAGALEAGSSTTVPPAAEPETAGAVNPGDQPEATGQPELSPQDPNTNDPSAALPVERNLSKNGRSIASANGDLINANEAKTTSLREYVTYSDGDGNVLKVSKKMAGLLQCKDNDLLCKKRLRDLQQKMAASAMTTDFTGVLDMLRKLQ